MCVHVMCVHECACMRRGGASRLPDLRHAATLAANPAPILSFGFGTRHCFFSSMGSCGTRPPSIHGDGIVSLACWFGHHHSRS